MRLLTKQDKSVVFPALCYQPKINELIFLSLFQNQPAVKPNRFVRSLIAPIGAIISLNSFLWFEKLTLITFGYQLTATL